MNQQLRIKVKELFKNKNLNPNTIKQVLIKNPNIKSQLQQQFNKHSKEYVSLGKLVILIVKDIELARCAVCGKVLDYNSTVSLAKYKFCSNKCKLSKEGNPFARVDIKEKLKQHFLIKYGVDNPAKSKEIQDKIKATNLIKYGVQNVYQSPVIKQKIKKNCLAKFNTEYYINVPQIKAKMIKSKYTRTYTNVVNKYKGSIQPIFTLDQYIGTNKLYRWKCCKCGNIFSGRHLNGSVGSRCFKCYPRKNSYTSTYQIQIANMIRQFGYQVDMNNRQLIRPKELDIVIPEKKLAIQFNGNYWHSFKNLKNRYYHFNKSNLCQAIGYRLIHIFQGQWKDVNKRALYIAKIKNILGYQQKVIYARKCNVVQLNVKDKNQFLNQNCIDGIDKSKIRLGMIYDDQIVGVMTFNDIGNKVYQISRFIWKINTVVVGGASKFIYVFKQVFDPNIIKVVVDRRFSFGEVYQKIGFKFVDFGDPIQVNVDGFKLFNSGYSKYELNINL